MACLAHAAFSNIAVYVRAIMQSSSEGLQALTYRYYQLKLELNMWFVVVVYDNRMYASCSGTQDIRSDWLLAFAPFWFYCFSPILILLGSCILHISKYLLSVFDYLRRMEIILVGTHQVGHALTRHKQLSPGSPGWYDKGYKTGAHPLGLEGGNESSGAIS